MKTVIIRLDLDRYNLRAIEGLLVEGLIHFTDAKDCQAVKALSELELYTWVKDVQRAVQQRKEAAA